MILAIDPGPVQSGWVLYLPHPRRIINSAIDDNTRLMLQLQGRFIGPYLVIEQVEHYGTGMPVGKSIFETVRWAGRFEQRILDGGGSIASYLPRRTVKLHLCKSMRATDANVRQALIDRFPATGGGKTPQIGIKKKPGPLYGIKSHEWSALALAVTFAETNDEH